LRDVAVDDLPIIGSSPDGLVLSNNTYAKLSSFRCPPFDDHNIDVLEVKAKFPFVKQRDDTLRLIGKRCAPYSTISVQYFCQAQLNMLVTGAKRCRFVVYTPYAGSNMMEIEFEPVWCRLMLQWVAKINKRFVITECTPAVDILWEHPDYRRFVRFTKDVCMRAGNVCAHVTSCNGPIRGPWFLSARTIPVNQLELHGSTVFSDTQEAVCHGDTQDEDALLDDARWSDWHVSVTDKVDKLWTSGFNMADLLDACCWSAVACNPAHRVCSALDRLVWAVKNGKARNPSALFMYFLN
jgi:hypothetical protein